MVLPHEYVIRTAQELTDESNVGVWFWLWLIVQTNVTWIAMDVWLYKHHHEMLTTEFREGLHNEWLGPLLCFLVAGTVAAFVWHMWVGAQR